MIALCMSKSVLKRLLEFSFLYEQKKLAGGSVVSAVCIRQTDTMYAYRQIARKIIC